MTVTIYIPKENGDLKYVADVEDEDRPDMALDAVLDEMPRLTNQSTTFHAVIDDNFITLEIDPDEEPVQRPKRAISVTGFNGAVAEDEGEEEAEQEEEEAPAPRRRGRPPGSKNKPKEAVAAPRRRGRPPGAKNKPKEIVAPVRRGRPAAKPAAKKAPFARSRKSDE